MTLQDTLSILNRAKAPNKYLTFFALEDVQQSIALAELQYPTEFSRNRAICQEMRVLRHEIHNGTKPKADSLLRPSKNRYRSNYRKDKNVKVGK